MKTKNLVLAVSLAGSLLALQAEAQSHGIIKKNARTVAAGVSVSTAHGKTTVTYKGAEVWSGKTSGKVTAKSKVVNGEEYAAAFDGHKVLWENVPGAARHLQ